MLLRGLLVGAVAILEPELARPRGERLALRLQHRAGDHDGGRRESRSDLLMTCADCGRAVLSTARGLCPGCYKCW